MTDELKKGWHWAVTAVQHKLTLRYYSGTQWKLHPSQLGASRAPLEVICRSANPQELIDLQERLSASEAREKVLSRSRTQFQEGLDNIRKAALTGTRVASQAEEQLKRILWIAEMHLSAELGTVPVLADGNQPIRDYMCPVHRSLDEHDKLRPFDNCVVCIRNERNELRKAAEPGTASGEAGS